MNTQPSIPSFSLYGEEKGFPDILHVERITDRAALHDWVISPHRHPNLHQVFLLLNGATRASIDGQNYSFDKPCLLSIPRHSVHGFTFSQGTDGFVLSLPVQAQKTMFEGDQDLSRAVASLVYFEPDAPAIALFEQIAAEHKAMSFGRNTLLQSLAAALLVVIARNAQSTHAPQNNTHLDRFEQLIASHIKSRWAVADYAAALGITPTQLSRICRSETGSSASKLIENHTFQEAQRSLAYTRLSIAEIGYSLGFDDPAYFSRAYRRHFGTSPSAYRREIAATYTD